MKGSGVRVPPSALREVPASSGFPSLAPDRVPGHWVRYWVRNEGPVRSTRVASAGARCAPARSSRAEHTMRGQLTFDLPDDGAQPAVAFRTIAEAAAPVRCCERTIRRAIDSGALRAGRVAAVEGQRGGYRIRP